MAIEFKISVVTPSVMKKMSIVETLDPKKHVLIQELADKFLLKRSEVTIILNNKDVHPFAKAKGNGVGRPRKIYDRHTAEEAITAYLKRKYEDATGPKTKIEEAEISNQNN